MANEIKLPSSTQVDTVIRILSQMSQDLKYLGLTKFGTLKYDTTEQPLPIRPWRNTEAFSIIHNDAGTSTGVSFDGTNNQINISGDLFDATLLKDGDSIIVSGAANAENNGTFTISSFTSAQITVSETTIVNESVGATVTVSMNGDIVDRQGGTNLDSYSFADTSSTTANILQWHAFADIINGKPSIIYICDRNIISNVSWDHIHATTGDGPDWIFGDNVTIDGVTYLCRSLTGGAADRDGGGSGSSYAGGLLPNEWDKYIMNGVDQSGGPFFAGAPEPENDDYLDGSQYLNNAARRRAHNQAWHWNAMYSWCQETVIDDASRRAFRGYHSARLWDPRAGSFAVTSYGFRPCLVAEL